LAGNSTDAEPIVVELLPDQPPTIDIVRPLDGAGVVEGSTIMVQVDAVDDVAVRSVELRLIGTLQDTQRFDPFIFQVPLPNVAGDHDIEACATDSLGNVACRTVTVTAF